MQYYRQPWIFCAIASLLIHGAVLSVALPWRGHINEEIIEISLVTEGLHSGRLGQTDEGALPRLGKERSKGRREGIAKSTLGGAKAGPAEGTAQQDAGQPAPHPAESFARGPVSDQSAPPSPQGMQDEAGAGGGGALQGSGRAPVSGEGRSGVGIGSTGAGSGVQAGGTGSANYAPIRFGGPDGPRFLHREVPEYPLYARRRRKEGKVLLLLQITAQGRLSSAEVMETSDPVFVGPSLEAVKRSTFAPAIRNGVSVAVKALLPIRFTLDEEVSTAQLRSHE
jgi:TonB family protein